MLEHAPAWMTEGRKQELRGIVADQLRDDPVKNGGLRQAARNLEASPWVLPGGVKQVKRLRDGRVMVEAAYRQPLALISMGGLYYMVSDRGVLLPEIYTPAKVQYVDVPVIEGVQSPPPNVGEVWSGEDVVGGLALAQLPGLQPYMDQVRAIDVSRRDGRGRLRLALRTDEGQVIWGLPPNHPDAVIEPTIETKLKWLRAVAAKNQGQIDAHGATVDLALGRVDRLDIQSEADSRFSTYQLGQ